jgi:hypothetical protein
MAKINCLFLNQDDLNALIRATVEALDIPARGCRHRHCRRHRSCDHPIHDAGRADCLHHLAPDARVAFNTLYELAVLIADNIRAAYPARSAEGRAQEETAIGIILAARRDRPKMAPRFDEWLALYRKRKPEDIENDPFWQRAHGVKPPAHGTYGSGYESATDAPPDLGENDSGQLAFADDAAIGDFRNYR